MFKIFQEKKIPTKPNHDLILKIKLELDQMVNLVNAALRLSTQDNPNIMEMEIIEARKRIEQARSEVQAGFICFQNAFDMWPEGKPVFVELNKFFENTSLFYNNLISWCELIQSPSFDIFKTQDKSRYQNYVLKNRRFSTEIDFHFAKANELLKQYTGIELLPFE